MKKVRSVPIPTLTDNDGEGQGESNGKPKRTKMKVLRPKIAFGGIDQDHLFDWGAGGSNGGGVGSMSKTKVKKLLASEKEINSFTDFDPTKKLKKGGKSSKGAFKSKSKFKRRN